MPPYFELKLEVYSYLLTEPVTSAHAKLVKTFNKAVGTIQKVLKENNEQVVSKPIYNKKKQCQKTLRKKINRNIVNDQEKLYWNRF